MLIGVVFNFVLVFIMLKIFGYFKDIIVILLFRLIIVVVGIEVF